VQSFINWKYKPVESVTINSGVQFKYFNLNGHYSFEPRIGAKWQFTPRQALTAGFGIHSKVDNISLYLFKKRMDDGTLIQNNKDLGFLKARHYVLGYENRISLNLNLKAEVYYQDLYDVPVEGYAENSSYSIINETNGFIITKLLNEGTGTNYGIELSLDKFFSNNYYFLVTGSLFDSKYKGSDGIERNSRFNNNYIANMVVGKEFIVGKKKNSAIDINIRGTYAGGQRYTPIDIEQSIAQEQEVRIDNEAFSKQRPEFMRFDFKVSYRRNKKKTTRVWELDIENVTNTLNITGDYWDYKKEQVVEYTQLGLLPNISYRIEF
jgi:hypothetical protein